MVFPALVSKDGDKKAIYQKAKRLLEMTGIEDLAIIKSRKDRVGSLQRVAICRALINEPDIVFGDEPTGSLDSKSSAEIMTMLLEINKNGKTIMIVTHDAKVAAKTERILFMVDGRDCRAKENE